MNVEKKMQIELVSPGISTEQINDLGGSDHPQPLTAAEHPIILCKDDLKSVLPAKERHLNDFFKTVLL